MAKITLKQLIDIAAVAKEGDTYDCGAFIETVTQSTVFANS
jgi:hypothetical protein